MKYLLLLTRWIVGLLFIFSGLVKANDPIGLSYKMQEFFDLWGMSSLDQFTLSFSVLIIAFELIAGVAVLLGWQMKIFAWLLLLLTLFFTFLTGYAVASEQFKDCGCFGNCLPITPMQSFLKDLVLTALILFLFLNRKKITAALPLRWNLSVMVMIVIFAFGFQWYSLKYLPVVDCLPYKIGNNLPEQMQPPPNAIPDSFAIVFEYNKEGKNYTFTPAELPADIDSYEFVKRSDRLVRKGNADPAIKGFVFDGADGTDSAGFYLSQPYTVLLLAENAAGTSSNWKEDFSPLYALAKEKNIPVALVTSQAEKFRSEVAGTQLEGIAIFPSDFTAIRTAARANPTVYLLKDGTVVDKRAAVQMDKLLPLLRAIETQPTLINPGSPEQTDSLP